LVGRRADGRRHGVGGLLDRVVGISAAATSMSNCGGISAATKSRTTRR
jgi:hypothetical protein